ncbi:hypothetical protein F3Y22_tig00110927pilonHSYRG00026 [Hibiscus syriacus]|uniref:PPM-type phosphatase domain-containing protein n=1 Tax=Hibiscus syriacus TaxID=106335 RepID=A0A6A2ZEG9_HIBSY|nr:hypothetical protein F3Y22_tig00110927pilonHSYRG00026 [Hibiscus syriacus]
MFFSSKWLLIGANLQKYLRLFEGFGEIRWSGLPRWVFWSLHLGRGSGGGGESSSGGRVALGYHTLGFPSGGSWTVGLYQIQRQAGDCRAVLSQNGVAEALTSDHQPSKQDEKDRVEALGGYVDCRHGVWRIQGSLVVSSGIVRASLTLMERVAAVGVESNSSRRIQFPDIKKFMDGFECARPIVDPQPVLVVVQSSEGRQLTARCHSIGRNNDSVGATFAVSLGVLNMIGFIIGWHSIFSKTCCKLGQSGLSSVKNKTMMMMSGVKYGASVSKKCWQNLVTHEKNDCDGRTVTMAKQGHRQETARVHPEEAWVLAIDVHRDEVKAKTWSRSRWAVRRTLE